MTFIIGCVPLLLLGWAVSRAFDRPFERALPAATLLAVLVLYLFGLFGVLRAGVYAVYALGVFAGAYCARGVIRDKKSGRTLCFPPAAMVALIAVPVIWLVSRGRLLTIWDEFSHWGTAVKNMYLLDAFGSAPSSTAIFKAYPPSISLLQYYFMRLEPSFNEATLFRAKDFLTVSLLMPFFAGVAWKDIKRLLPLLVIVFALPLIDYYYFYRCILVDGVMGLLFLYVLASYWDADGLDAFSFCSLSLGIFALALSKESGYGFAALALLILFADWALARRGKKTEQAPDSVRPWQGDGKLKLTRLLPLLPVLALLFAVLSWKLNFRLSGAADYWNTSAALSPARVLADLRNPAPYQKDVFERFFSALFALRDDTYAVRLSPFLWIALPVSAACLAHRAEPDEGVKKRIARLTVLLLAGYALWLLALLFSYLFVFADFEALNLDGLERYSSAYQLGMFGFSVYLLVTSWRRGAGKKFTSSLVLLLCAELALFSFSDLVKATFVAPQYNRYTQTQREELPDVPDFAAFLDPARDRVCLIAQQADNTGLAYYYARYKATPVYAGVVGSWSVGEKYSENDDWTAAFTCEEWTRALAKSDYTYLYLLRVDDAFIERFGAAFPDKTEIVSGALFKIVRSGTAMTLTKVPVPTP